MACGRGDRVGDDPTGAGHVRGDDADASVAEIDEVLRGGRGTAAVVDVDARYSRHRLLVDEDDRQLAPLQPVDRRRVGVARVDERAVHRHVAGRDRLGSLRSRQQGQGEPGRCQLLGNRAEKRGRHLVAEGVPQRIGQEHADRARRAAGKRTRRRIGAAVAELVGRSENPLTQIRGQLVGSRERVRHCHPAHADSIGDRLQRHSGHPMILVRIRAET